MKNLRDLEIRCQSKSTHRLNSTLIYQQKLDDSQIEEIKWLHCIKNNLFDLMDLEESNSPALKLCVEMLQDLEFKAQEVWGFKKDDSLHSWWHKSPHCTCCSEANEKYFGKFGKIINRDYPLHGHMI